MRTLIDFIKENEILREFYNRFGQVKYTGFEYYDGKKDGYEDIKKSAEEDLKETKNTDIMDYIKKKFNL